MICASTENNPFAPYWNYLERKNNGVETRTFLKVLYLGVSGISFVNDKMHAF